MLTTGKKLKSDMKIQGGSSRKAGEEKNKKKSRSNLWILHREGKKKCERTIHNSARQNKTKNHRMHKYLGAK